MKQSKTGGKRLQDTIKRGLPFKGGLWVDTYNKTWSDIAGTILTGVDFRNMYYVSQCVETE